MPVKGFKGSTQEYAAYLKAKVTDRFGEPLEVILRRLHWDQELTILEMSEMFGVSRRTITTWLDGLSIPRRSQPDTTRMKMARLSPEERKQRIQAFHDKARADGWSKRHGLKGKDNPKYTERVPQPCKWCGKVAMVVPSFLNKRNVYCCAEHRRWWMRENWRGPRNPNYKGGIVKREYCSHALRKYILERDEYKCRICNDTTKPLEMHHCVPYEVCQAHEAHNLLTLCLTCHHKVHQQKLVVPFLSIHYNDAELPKAITRKNRNLLLLIRQSASANA